MQPEAAGITDYTATSNTIAFPYTCTALSRPGKHLPRHNQNPHLKQHAHNEEPKHHVPVLARRPLQQPQQRVHVQAAGIVALTLFDDGSEQLRRRSNHTSKVEDEKNERFQDHDTWVQAALERKKHHDPDERLCHGADGDAVWDDPVIEHCQLHSRKRKVRSPDCHERTKESRAPVCSADSPFWQNW